MTVHRATTSSFAGATSSPADVAAWCREYSEHHDVGLRERIVAHHQWLVSTIARQLRRTDEPIDDLLQVGNIGLLQAVDRFDPFLGTTFKTFASATIRGVLLRHLTNSWHVHVPRDLKLLRSAISTAVERLNGVLMRSPTHSDIAVYLGISRERVLEALEAGASFRASSLDADDAGSSSDDTTQSMMRPAGDVGFDLALQRIDIARLLRSLPARQRQILYFHFFQDLTQTEIAVELNMSQAHVSRSMTAALASLRARDSDGDELVSAAS